MLGTILLDGMPLGSTLPSWLLALFLNSAEEVKMIDKGVALTGLTFSLINKSTGEAVTSGVVSSYITKDGGTQTATENSAVHEGNGQWSIDLTASETTADVIGLLFIHTEAFLRDVTLIATDIHANVTILKNLAVGPGADTVTLTINDDEDVPVADADVWITSDAEGTTVVAGVFQTDSNGQVVVLLDAGNAYYLWTQKDGMNSIQGQAFVAEADT